MKKTSSAIVVGLITLCAGCAMSYAQPVTGGLVNVADGAITATGKPVGSKRGESCAKSLFGAVAWGDASIQTAAKAGAITEISTVDSDNFGVLGIWAKNCTVVTGE